MSQAATLTTTLALPRSAGDFPLPPWPPPPGITVQYEQDVSVGRLVITGAGTLTIPSFPLLPANGAQFLLVTLDPVDDSGLALTAPVRFNLSGNTSGTIWLPIGGGQFSMAAPGTTNGVTGLAVVTTAACVVRVQCGG